MLALESPDDDDDWGAPYDRDAGALGGLDVAGQLLLHVIDAVPGNQRELARFLHPARQLDDTRRRHARERSLPCWG